MAPLTHVVKDRLRRALRATLVALNGLGVGLLLRRLGCGRGAGIVMTHCIGHVPETDYLPADMKTSTAKVDRLLAAFRRRGLRCVPVRELVAALEAGGAARDLVAFTMDDGYRDNLVLGLPLLARHGASGTVFVETGVLERRVPSWMHRYFWVVHEKGEEFFARAYAARSGEPEVQRKLLAALAGGSDHGALYDLKRVLKYEADPADRERVSREVLAEAGGDDAVLARAYLDWDDVRALDEAGVEVAAHTVSHEILSRLDRPGLEREIGDCVRSLQARLGRRPESFAYPFGRRWDYTDATIEVLKEQGFRSACAAIDGTNDPTTDRFQLRRLPLNDDIPLGAILAELDGTFELARRVFRIRV